MIPWQLADALPGPPLVSGVVPGGSSEPGSNAGGTVFIRGNGFGTDDQDADLKVFIGARPCLHVIRESSSKVRCSYGAVNAGLCL